MEESEFKGQLTHEDFQFFFRRHWMRFLEPFFLGIPVTILIIVVFFLFGHFTLMIDYVVFRAFYVFLTLIISAVFLNLFFIQVMDYYFHMVIVTDCRIIVVRKTIFLKNNSDAIDLTKIQDIAVEAQGLFRNYLRYGELVITLSTSAPSFIIDSVPNPHFYLEWLNRVKREHIMNRQEKKKTLSEKRSGYLQDIDSLTEQ